MLTLPAAATTHLGKSTTTLTVCYAIWKKNGEVLRGTAHDRDVTIASGTYAGTYRARTAAFATDVRAAADGSVPNVGLDGALRVDASIDDLTVEDLEAGLYDQARAVLLLVDWADPSAWQKVLCAGTLGPFERDSDGRWRSDARGLVQALSQQFVQTYSERCNVKRFGDTRCKFDVGAVTRTGTVTSVTDRRTFVVTLDAGPAPVGDTYYNGGVLQFTSGANEDFERETRTVELDGDTATIALWDEAPADIEVGDTISLEPGCDRRFETCRDVHANQVNFRGYGLFAVGRDRLMRGAS